MISRDEMTNRSESQQSSATPAISLPKGGGAIRGMGEKFAANPVTGSRSMSIPLAVSPGRSGFALSSRFHTTPVPATGPSVSAGT
jgi:hypothetical protein